MNGLLNQGRVAKPTGLFAWQDLNAGRTKPTQPTTPKPPVVTGPSVPANGGVPVFGTETGGGDGPSSTGNSNGSGGISPGALGAASNVAGLVGLATGNTALSQAASMGGLAASVASAPTASQALGTMGLAAAANAGLSAPAVGAIAGAMNSGVPGAIAGAATSAIMSAVSTPMALAIGIAGLATGRSLFSEIKGLVTPVESITVGTSTAASPGPGPGAVSSVDAGISGMGVNNADSTVSNSGTIGVQDNSNFGSVSTSTGIADSSNAASTGMAVNSSGQTVSNDATIAVQDDANFGVVASGADGIADATSGVVGSTAATADSPDGPDGNNAASIGGDSGAGVGASGDSGGTSSSGHGGGDGGHGMDGGFDAGDGGGGGGGGDCFAAGTLIELEGGLKKPIEEVSIGDKVVGAFGGVNTVKFIEYLPSTHWDKLYSPVQGIAPFATINHPVMMGGTYTSPSPEDTRNRYPWIRGVVAADQSVVAPSNGCRVYNLWVSGDGTYTVNGFGTTSLLGDGGWLRCCMEQGIFTGAQVEQITRATSTSGPVISYGSYCWNNWLGKLNWKWANKTIATLMTKPALRPIALSAVAVVGACKMAQRWLSESWGAKVNQGVSYDIR